MLSHVGRLRRPDRTLIRLRGGERKPVVLWSRHDADAAGNVVVAPQGVLDSSSATALVESLHKTLAQQPTTIILDLSLVTALDRSGFSILVAGLREIRTRSVGIALSGEMAPKVYRIVEMAMLASIVAPPQSR
jgi:anti-anti-sigma factor